MPEPGRDLLQDTVEKDLYEKNTLFVIKAFCSSWVNEAEDDLESLIVQPL